MTEEQLQELEEEENYRNDYKNDWIPVDDTYEINYKGIVRTQKMKKIRTNYYYPDSGSTVYLADGERHLVKDLISKYFFPVTEELVNREEYFKARNTVNSCVLSDIKADNSYVSKTCRNILHNFESLVGTPLTDKQKEILNDKMDKADKAYNLAAFEIQEANKIKPIVVYHKVEEDVQTNS